MTARPKTNHCLDCSTPCTGVRCRGCWLRSNPRKPRGPRLERTGYDWAERQRRKRAVDEWIADNGMVCPGWARPAHEVTGKGSDRLSADHIVSVKAGGPESGPLQVLCVSCNGRKREKSGATRRPAVRPTEPTPAPTLSQVQAETPSVVTEAPALPPEPPADLADNGRRVWIGVVNEFDLGEHELALLREACRTADLLDKLREIVATEGLMVPVLPYGSKMHPALVESRQQRIVLARQFAALGLPMGEVDQDNDTRRPAPRLAALRGVYKPRSSA